MSRHSQVKGIIREAFGPYEGKLCGGGAAIGCHSSYEDSNGTVQVSYGLPQRADLSPRFVDRLNVLCAVSLLPKQHQTLLKVYFALESAFATESGVIAEIARREECEYRTVRDAFDSAIEEVGANL